MKSRAPRDVPMGPTAEDVETDFWFRSLERHVAGEAVVGVERSNTVRELDVGCKRLGNGGCSASLGEVTTPGGATTLCSQSRGHSMPPPAFQPSAATASSSLNIYSSALDVQNSLLSISGLSKVKVSKPIDTQYFSSWLVTFQSLKQSNALPLLQFVNPSNLVGNVSTSTHRNGFSSIVLALDIPSGNNNFTLYWDNKPFPTKPNYVSAPELISMLENHPDILYANVERYGNTVGYYSWLIQIVPTVDDYSQSISDDSSAKRLTVFFPTEYSRCSNYCDQTTSRCLLSRESCDGDVECPGCLVYNPHPLPVYTPLNTSNVIDSFVSISMDNVGCQVYTEGVFCGVSGEEEYQNVKMPPDTASIVHALESLRNIQEVKVSKYDISLTRVDSDFILFGYDFDVTFVRSSYNSLGSR